MRSKSLLRITLAIFMILGISQGCMANVSMTPLPTLAVATTTVTLPPTNTPVPTIPLTSTPDEVATLHSIETASIQTLISTVQPEVLDEYPSPDGKWRVEVVRYDCINYTNQDYSAIIAYEQLKLIDLSAGTDKFVDEQPQACDGIGMAGFDGLYWSPNNRYFYYTDSREGFPETCGNYAMPAIYQLDPLTGETMMVGGAHFSPDKTKLAMWERNEIVIWDLNQGEVARVQSLERVRFNGEISWSPDGQSLVYLQTEWDCAPDYGKTYLTRLDLADMSQELLFEHEAPGFGTVSWDTMNQLTLRDGNNSQWTYSISKRELKAAPSSTPTSASATPNAAQSEQVAVYYISDDQLFLQRPGGTRQALVVLPELGQVKDALRVEENIFIIRERGLQKVSIIDGSVDLIEQFPNVIINGRLLADLNQKILIYAVDEKVKLYDLAQGTMREVFSRPGFFAPIGLTADGTKLYLVPMGGDPEFPEVWILSFDNGEVKPFPIGIGTEAALSPNSQILAIASTHFVELEQQLEYKLTFFDLASPQTPGQILALPNSPSHFYGRLIWSPDSQKIYFLLRPGAPYEDPTTSYGLWSFEVDSGNFDSVAAIENPAMHFISLSSDGEWALLAPETETSLTLVGLESGEIETIEAAPAQIQFVVVREPVIPD